MSSEVDFNTLTVEETPIGQHSVRLVSIISTDETWGRQAIEKYLETHQEETTEPQRVTQQADEQSTTPTPKSSAQNYWVDGDNATRNCMIACGLLSGFVCNSKRSCLKYLTSVYHLLVCILLVSIIAIYLFWKPALQSVSDSVSSYEQASVVIDTVWRVQTTLCTCLLFVSCNRQNGIDSYYQQLMLCVKQTSYINKLSREECKNFKLVHQLLTFVAVLLVALLMVPKVYVYVVAATGNLEALELFGYIGDFFVAANYSFLSVFLISLMWTNWYLFKTLNVSFKQHMRKSRQQLLAEELNEYRVAHLRLCRFFEVSIRSTSLLVGIFFIGTLTTWLLIIRTSVYVGTSNAGDWYLHLGCYLVPSAVIVLLMVIFSEHSSNEVSIYMPD